MEKPYYIYKERKMKAVKLNTDYDVPMIGLGTWKSDPGEVYQAIRWAIKLGYRHIDCAPIYGNEKEIGQALHDAVSEGDIKREELFVTSKLWNDSHEPDAVLPALKQTLADLQLDYLDMYLIHWPVAQQRGTTMPHKDDDMIPLQDMPLYLTWAEMEKAQQQGLVHSIGVSNFGVKHLSELVEKAKIIPAVDQVECHPLLQQNELLEYCRNNMIALTAYSPLGSHHENGEPNLFQNEIIMDIAGRLKATSAQVLLAWQLKRGVIVIPKTVHDERLQENFAASALELDDEDMRKIASLDSGHRFIDGGVFARGGYTVDSIFA